MLQFNLVIKQQFYETEKHKSYQKKEFNESLATLTPLKKKNEIQEKEDKIDQLVYELYDLNRRRNKHY